MSTLIVFNMADVCPGVPGADGSYLNRELGPMQVIVPDERAIDYIGALHELGFSPKVVIPD